MDILKDDQAFGNLICLIVVVGLIVGLVVKSIRGDNDLDL